MQKRLAATYGRLGIRSRLQQKLLAYFLFCHRLALHELLQLLQIIVRIESDALSFSSVAPCTPRLLVIAFQTLGNVIMNNKAYVGLVDTHAKRNGSYNDINLLHQEIILVLRAGG